MYRSVFILLTFPFALAGCGQSGDADTVAEQGETEVVAVTNYEPALVELPEAFLSKDCTVFANAYAKTLGEKLFPVAAQAWAEPIGTDKLSMGYQDYGKPDLQIGEVREEGAAGSLFCEVTVTLRDGDNPQTPLKQGTLAFRRVNDVPGATTDQLRWRIIKSTLDEEMANSRETPPA